MQKAAGVATGGLGFGDRQGMGSGLLTLVGICDSNHGLGNLSTFFKLICLANFMSMKGKYIHRICSLAHRECHC